MNKIIFSRVVFGHVYKRRPFPQPAANILVEAFDIKVGKRVSLGTSTTNAEGLYRIFYKRPIQKIFGNQQIDLYLQCYEKENDKIGRVLTKSKLYANIPSSFEIDLFVPEEIQACDTNL